MDNDRLAEIRQLLDNVRADHPDGWWIARLFETARDLLAEVERLQAELAAEQRSSEQTRDILLERIQALERALPASELLEEAADICGPDFHLQYRALRESARRIREARGEH